MHVWSGRPIRDSHSPPAGRARWQTRALEQCERRRPRGAASGNGSTANHRTLRLLIVYLSHLRRRTRGSALNRRGGDDARRLENGALRAGAALFDSNDRARSILHHGGSKGLARVPPLLEGVSSTYCVVGLIRGSGCSCAGRVGEWRQLRGAAASSACACHREMAIVTVFCSASVRFFGVRGARAARRSRHSAGTGDGG